MKKCLFCGTENPESAQICQSCGISFEYYENQDQLTKEEREILRVNERSGDGKKDPDVKKKLKEMLQKPNPRKIGALAAFALFSLILCFLGSERLLEDALLVRLASFLPGLSALACALNVNCCETRREQERKENMALLLGIVSVLLGVAMLLIHKNTL